MFAEEQEEFNIFEGELQVLRMLFVDSQGNQYKYGINTQKVEAIIELCPMTALPKENEPIVGILSYRSVPIPVLDLSLLVFGEKTQQVGKYPPRIVICKTLDKLIGLVVQRALPVLRISNKDVYPPPDELSCSKKLPMTGVYNDRDSHLLMLDIESILSQFSDNKEENEEVSRNMNLEGKSILFAEDSKVMQMRIKSIFSQLGVKATITSNGAEAFEILSKNPEKFDMLFTDIEMPILNGIQLARKVKADSRLSKIPIIFNSSISNEALIQEIKSENLGEYIVKFNVEEIVEKLQNIFADETGLHLF